jgi:NAD(P)-dependent dehydrogenase (short-subunit alcohol dehydrogenase family)
MFHYIQGGIINGSMLALELMGRGYGGNGGVIINMSSVAGIHIKSSFVLVCLIEGES